MDDDDATFPIVSRLDELIELGNNNKIICPFQVVAKIKDQEHHFGNVSVKYNEVICAGDCANCSDGRSCKQLITTLHVSINNTITDIPEMMFITDVGIGCACTPDDIGVLGEMIV